MTHRDAEWPHGAIALGHLAPPHRRGLVLASFESLPKRLDALLKVGRKLLNALPVNTASALAVQLPPRQIRTAAAVAPCQQLRDGMPDLSFFRLHPARRRRIVEQLHPR